MSEASAAKVAEGTAQELREIEAQGWPDDEGVYGWLEGVLDVRRTYLSDGTLYGVSLLVGFGGPNVWLDFVPGGCEVQVSWWSDEVRVWVPCPEVSDEVVEALDFWSVER
jgi:hypothetical protein